MIYRLPVIILLLVANCTLNWGNFKRYSINEPNNLEETGTKKISGSDCTFFGYWWHNNVAEAVRDAIKKSPTGTVGLKNVDINAATYPFMSCIEVEGFPVKEKETAKPSSKTSLK